MVRNASHPISLELPENHTVAYKDVEARLLEHHPHADTDYLRRGYEFGKEKHEGQVRKSGEPYYNHPVAVAYILASSKLDLDTVVAGFLHDVIEDCGVETRELAQKFGNDLARIVDGVTKIGKVKFRDKNQAQAENYRKMILAMSEDMRVLLVKLADRYHNMLTLQFMPPEKQHRIAKETLDIYTPLAHRIGMGQLKGELERLSFYYLEADAYRDLAEQMEARRERNRNFLERIEKELKGLLKQNSVEGEVASRIKSEYSIFKKMRHKGRNLDGIYDYYAFRILTDTVENCYKLFGLLHGQWQHIPGRIKDFIATPKPNLYQSLHTTLISEGGTPFEVQIRTYMMHRIAEEGMAAHWTYKNGRLTSVGRNEFGNWIKRLAEDHSEVQDHEEFLESIKGELNTSEILVFTPASEIKTLQKGATPLDFAYLIHTEVGHKCVGAKVDGKMVPLSSRLQSGSIVEILTNPNQKPSRQWLKIVKSPSARAKIRAWLRAEERSKSVELGRTLFERELRKHKITLKTITNQVILGKIPELGYKKLDEFYAALGFGKLTPGKAVVPFLPESERETANTGQEVREKKFTKAMKTVEQESRSQILVRGEGDLMVSLAKCCNPIIGDDVEGYVSVGRGIVVHKKDCRNLKHSLKNPERRIDVAWDEGAQSQLFRVKLRVFTEDHPGMIAKISTAINDTNTNVCKFQADTNKENLGVFDIQLQISSLSHLDKVIQNLKGVKGFLSCERLT